MERNEMTKNKRYDVAKELTGGEIPDWKFQQQLKNLIMMLEDMHQNRPLMTVADMLDNLHSLGER
jgi:hypothetical protein